MEARVETYHLHPRIDDFGIKVEGNNHPNYLVSTLKKYYDITVDWKG